MYFFPADVFRRLREAGLPLDPRAWGAYTHQGRTGVVVNAEALTLAQLQPYANAVAGTPGGDSGFRLDTDALGVQTVVLDTRSEPRDAARAATTGEAVGEAGGAPDPGRRAPTEPDGGADDDADGAPGPAFMPYATAARPRPGMPATERMLIRLRDHYAPRLDRPLEVVRQPADPHQPAGLPAPRDGAYLIALNVVPAGGSFDPPHRRPLSVINPDTGRSDAVYVPEAPTPADMTPLTVGDLTVGCCDADRLCLYVDAPGLVGLLAPAWLETLARAPARPAEEPDDAAHDSATARALAHAALAPDTDDDATADNHRRTVASAERRIAGLDLQIAAYREIIAGSPARFDADSLQAQLDTLTADGRWTVRPERGDLAIAPAIDAIADPRGGRMRRAPGSLAFSLRRLLAGEPPLMRTQASVAADQRHPRLLGSGFLSEEVETAIREMVAARDLVGALELAREVLTSFQPDDPDVAALDAWPLA